MAEMKTPIKATVEIRREADGLVREYHDQDFYGPFIWEDGNYACDCNRYLFFCRSVGEPENEDEEAPENQCGNERYAIRIKDGAGTILYQDERW